MARFLQTAARHIISRHGSDFSQIEIVLPTRRAAFFMKRELASEATQPVFSPRVRAIDDYLESLSQLEPVGPVELIFELYRQFTKQNSDIRFDRFMGWATTLLADFERVDLYLVKPDLLFDYLTEAKSIARWQMEAPPGRPVQPTEGATAFFNLFESIKEVYYEFRGSLTGKGKAYRGLMYRLVAEDPEAAFTGSNVIHTYFVGFNAFTPAENQIIRYLTDQSRATLLWDTDAYYMDANLSIDGGKVLRDYRSAGTYGKIWNWTGRDLLDGEKEIGIYGVPNATLQAKVAGDIYARRKEGELQPETTAIVLADESLLSPVLLSLDDTVKDLNITMGLPMKHSQLFTLIDNLFELQLNRVDGLYNHKLVSQLLNNPFIRQYEASVLTLPGERSIVQQLLFLISSGNRVYLSLDDISRIGGKNELFDVLFRPWGNSSAVAIGVFYDLIDLLRGVYRTYKNSIETEYLYQFYTLLKQFEQVLAEHRLDEGIVTLRAFLYEMVRQVAIPFSGEPVSNLQILGMLETRALDFDRVIILSANEGILPVGKTQNSLIPMDIALASGLPVFYQQEAIMSYHFYRLLQRAREVHILYVNTVGDSGTSEPSRFVRQLEWELPGYNPLARIRKYSVAFDEQAVSPAEDVIVKDEKVIRDLKHYLSNNGLYPTELNLLIKSPKEFYVSCVLGLREDRELEEELGMDKLGTWLHRVFEILDIDYFIPGTHPDKQQITGVLREQFEELFPGFITDSGLNKVYYQVGEQQVLSFLNAQTNGDRSNRILAAEQHLRASVALVIDGQELKIQLGGKIDRVELSPQGEICVMDYKTGKIELKSAKMFDDPEQRDQLICADPGFGMGYVRQLWLYQYLVLRRMKEENGLHLGNEVFSDNPVVAGFYSLRMPDKVFMNPLSLSKNRDAGEYLSETERLLTEIIRNLLDPNLPLR